MAESQDYWTSDKYQASASFVPKLASKIVQWLNLQEDDVLLDLGCGDGVLDLEFSRLLARGNGRVHGIDGSPAMIDSATTLCKDTNNCSFEALDANDLSSKPTLQSASFTKVFSNAAFHWVLRPESSRRSLFPAVHRALASGGLFAFEMGGLGNVAEMRTAILMAVARRVGMEAAVDAEPWFFPEEQWIRGALQEAGFRVDRLEREWRPTEADKGGVEGWVRLFGNQTLNAIKDEVDREAAVKEATQILQHVCKNPAGGEMISYVRLRCVATKL